MAWGSVSGCLGSLNVSTCERTFCMGRTTWKPGGGALDDCYKTKCVHVCRGPTEARVSALQRRRNCVVHPVLAAQDFKLNFFPVFCNIEGPPLRIPKHSEPCQTRARAWIPEPAFQFRVFV